MASVRDSSLSSSVSTGWSWKSERIGDRSERRLLTPTAVKRWDGAARTCSDWDNLRRDPELWFRSGNCLIHLYGRGQSQRGPAFKVPFSALLAAKCHPLIERFLGGDLPALPGTTGLYDYLDRWSESNPSRRVELYIPAPPGADKKQSFLYHLATRNFIAWVFQRSLVGEHLGGALVALLDSMHEFRLPEEDHLDDLVGYMDEEGYLDMNGLPNHALAVLHLAEYFQLRDMYIDAFTHCAGMNERLFTSPEYHNTSPISRKLIKRSRADLDLRLGRAGNMLRHFLEEELSEAHLGLSSGARAHLERFRSFLHAFYTSRLGYYPPPSIDSRAMIFDPEIYQMMHDDFDALYELLVDESFTSSESIPTLAQGGICTVQSVHSFDARCRYRSLDHPLPLLPEIMTPQNSRRVSWLSLTRDKLKPDQRLVAHAALVKASNNWKTVILQNDLVRAYRKFEEESIVPPLRVDRNEKVNLVDARKVRWILIYSIYQVLCDVVVPPPEARDTGRLNYNVGVSTANLPPWKDGAHGLVRMPTGMTRRSSLPTFTEDLSMLGSLSMVEIKPDIDYFALTHKTAATPPPRPPVSIYRQMSKTTEGRSRSLTRSLSKSGTIRRSLSIFQKEKTAVEAEKPRRAEKPRKPAYHEIVVHGYGNGTNVISIDTKSTPSKALASRTPSNSSTSNSSVSGSESSRTADTSSSSLSPISPNPPPFETPKWTALSPPTISARGRSREVVSYILPSSQSEEALQSPPQTSLRMPRPVSAAFVAGLGDLTRLGSDCTAIREELVPQRKQAVPDMHELSPSPLRINKTGEMGTMMLPEEAEAESEIFTSARGEDYMDQFIGLGGHTDMGVVKV